MDDVPFGTLADHDDSLGDMLETFAGGRYLWLPFSSLRSLEFAKPKGLLDHIWARCDYEDRDGRRATVHIPVLYAESATHEDPMVRAGRVTQWVDLDGVAFRGYGPRVLRADDREVPLLNVRSIHFDA